MHPWEDWAETFAHYLHIRDTLETAAALGSSSTGPRAVASDPTLIAAPEPEAAAAVRGDHRATGCRSPTR